MRLVLDRFPRTSPFKTEIEANGGDGFVAGRFRDVSRSIKDADVECDAEVVVAESASRMGDDFARLGPALSMERVLLVIGAQAADDLNGDARSGGASDKGSGVGADEGMKCGNSGFTASIDASCDDAVRHFFDRAKTIINGCPGKRARLAIGLHSDGALHLTDHLIEGHGWMVTGGRRMAWAAWRAAASSDARILRFSP